MNHPMNDNAARPLNNGPLGNDPHQLDSLKVFDGNQQPEAKGGEPTGNSLAKHSQTHGASELIYQSRCMHEIVSQALRFAKSSATVLLTGESGTGKELFAKLIHNGGNRSERRFVRVNCAALSETLLESELFGHERGAFTGAVERRVGRFEWADRGTLLLDEVSEIPINLQAKLLRTLEEYEIQRVGSNQSQKIDVRVIATSNRNLSDEVLAGKFRMDLFHRLNVLHIEVPPLRTRREDIPVLANRFLQRFQHEAVRPLQGISTRVLKQLSDYAWPGNVRQLRNTIHRACVLATSSTLDGVDLPEIPQHSFVVPPWLLEMNLAELERLMILENIKRFGGNKTLTAQQLGVTTRTLSNKIKIYLEQGLISTDGTSSAS